MEQPLLKISFLTACALTGLLCGASLDQSIKQLPARHKIGTMAFSAYVKAADLSNGVVWYALLGMGAALSCIVTAVLTMLYFSHYSYCVPLYLAGGFAICHSVCTSLAAPLYHKQKKLTNENEVKNLIDKFERIQTVRTIFICLNLIALLWGIYLKIQ